MVPDALLYAELVTVSDLRRLRSRCYRTSPATHNIWECKVIVQVIISKKQITCEIYVRRIFQFDRLRASDVADARVELNSIREKTGAWHKVHF